MVTKPPLPERVRRRETAENRRAAILRAARAVFARQGFANTMMDDIAEAAGVAKGTVYLYFASKDQIFMEALLERARELETLASSALAAAGSCREKIRVFIEVRVRYLREHQDFFRIYGAEFRNMCIMRKPLDAEVHELIRKGEIQLAQALAVGVSKSEIRSVDPELAALMISDLTRGLIDRRLLSSQVRDDAHDVEVVLEFVYRALAIA
jgi:AcrR family transcriptional regulator